MVAAKNLRLQLESLEARDVPAYLGELDPTFGTGGLAFAPARFNIPAYPTSVVDSAGRTIILTTNNGLTVTPSHISITPNPTNGILTDQEIAASGTTGSTSITLAWGALPPGMRLTSTGELSGESTQVGTYAFTVRVTDGSGATAVQSYLEGIGLPSGDHPRGPCLLPSHPHWSSVPERGRAERSMFTMRLGTFCSHSSPSAPPSLVV